MTTHPNTELTDIRVWRTQIRISELSMERTKREAARLRHRANADRLVIMLFDECHRRSQPRFGPDVRSFLLRHRRHTGRSHDAAAGVPHGQLRSHYPPRRVVEHDH